MCLVVDSHSVRCLEFLVPGRSTSIVQFKMFLLCVNLFWVTWATHHLAPAVSSSGWPNQSNEAEEATEVERQPAAVNRAQGRVRTRRIGGDWLVCLRSEEAGTEACNY